MSAKPLVLFVACWLALAAPLQAQVSDTDEEIAKALFRAGQVAFNAGGFAEALQRFQEAYQRSPKPQLLYNLGLAADRLRQDEDALRYFRAYLNALPEAENRVEVENRIRALEQAMAASAAAPAATPKSAPATAATAAAPAAPVASKSARTPGPALATASTDTPHDRGEPEAGVLSRWWFWAAAGGVVVGVAVTAIALSGGSDGVTEPVRPNSGVVVVALEAE